MGVSFLPGAGKEGVGLAGHSLVCRGQPPAGTGPGDSTHAWRLSRSGGELSTPSAADSAGPLQGPGSRDSRRPFTHSQGVPPGGGGADPSTAGPGVSLDGAPPEPRAGLVWGCSTRYLVND